MDKPNVAEVLEQLDCQILRSIENGHYENALEKIDVYERYKRIVLGFV